MADKHTLSEIVVQKLIDDICAVALQTCGVGCTHEHAHGICLDVKKVTPLLADVLQKEREETKLIIETWAKWHSGSESCQRHAKDILLALDEQRRS